MNKPSYFLVATLFIIGISSVTDSFAQETVSYDPWQFPKVLLQIQVRNSEGNLVIYTEGNQIINWNLPLLHSYLDTIPNKQIIHIDGKKFQLIQWQERTYAMEKRELFSSHLLWVQTGESWQWVLHILHNGYEVESGDSVLPFWTVIRELD